MSTTNIMESFGGFDSGFQLGFARLPLLAPAAEVEAESKQVGFARHSRQPSRERAEPRETARPGATGGTGATLSRHDPSAWDVAAHFIGSVSGKDRLGKVLMYVLRIIHHHAAVQEARIKAEIGFDASTYTGSKLGMLRNLWNDPARFRDLTLALFAHQFVTLLLGVILLLSMYRQALRFGKTPLRVRELVEGVRKHARSGASLAAYLTSESTVTLLVDLHYGWFDELLLLYKMKLLTNDRYFQLASRQLELSWYLSIMLSWKAAWGRLQALREREMQVTILLQVRIKAAALLRQFLELIHAELGLTVLHLWSDLGASTAAASTVHDNELADIRAAQLLEVLDLCRLLCDFVFDSIDVWRLQVPRTVYLALGALLGAFGTAKAWQQLKQAVGK